MDDKLAIIGDAFRVISENSVKLTEATEALRMACSAIKDVSTDVRAIGDKLDRQGEKLDRHVLPQLSDLGTAVNEMAARQEAHGKETSELVHSLANRPDPVIAVAGDGTTKISPKAWAAFKYIVPLLLALAAASPWLSKFFDLHSTTTAKASEQKP